MPVYDFSCPDCGPFEALRAMAECTLPCDCPACGSSAPRVMLNVPNLAIMPSGRRHAHATNERSADSPRRSGHGPGCGCCGSSAGKKVGSKTLTRPDGSKSFPSKRPWMISH